MKKLWIGFIIVILLVLAFCGLRYYKIHNNKKEEILNQKQLVSDIKNNYFKNVKVNKETKLYILNDNKYEEHGTISKDFYLTIDMPTKEDDPYYKISNTEYYIYYKDVTKCEETIEDDKRYKNFIPFDNNVVIKDSVKLYLEDNTYLILKEDINAPLIIKDNDKYGFIYLDKLFYVNKSEAILEEHINSDAKKAKKVLTLTYHFIYDPEEEKCNQSICQKLEQFESHLKYLTENNYFIMKLSELEMYIDGKVNIPYNSIVLTIDDGYISEKAIRLLEQYKVYATLFIITGNFDNFDKFKSPYLDLQSHTDTMHKQYECRGMGEQGGGLLCRDKEKAIEDLKASQEKLGGDDKVVYLSYPFFDFNEHAISILKEAGFRMGFIGQWTPRGFSTVGTNKYKVPRLTVFNDMTVEKLKQALAY